MKSKSDELFVRKITKEDYVVIQTWFTQRGWELPPMWEHLPQGDRALAIVDEEDVMVCCGFIYLTETPLTILEWVATNYRTRSLKRRYKAIKLLLSAAKTVTLKYRPDGILIQFLVSSGLKKLYLKEGFIEGDTNLTSVIWRDR